MLSLNPGLVRTWNSKIKGLNLQQMVPDRIKKQAYYEGITNSLVSVDRSNNVLKIDLENNVHLILAGSSIRLNKFSDDGVNDIRVALHSPD